MTKEEAIANVVSYNNEINRTMKEYHMQKSLLDKVIKDARAEGFKAGQELAKKAIADKCNQTAINVGAQPYDEWETGIVYGYKSAADIAINLPIQDEPHE